MSNSLKMSIGHTFSMGKYEFVRLDLGVEINVTEEDDWDELVAENEEWLHTQLEKVTERAVKEHAKLSAKK